MRVGAHFCFAFCARKNDLSTSTCTKSCGMPSARVWPPIKSPSLCQQSVHTCLGTFRTAHYTCGAMRRFFLHGTCDIRAIFPFNLFGVKFSQTENIIAYFPGLIRLQSSYIHTNDSLDSFSVNLEMLSDIFFSFVPYFFFVSPYAN